MDSKLERPYRKNLKMKGLIYFGGEEQEIIVKNLSLTGLLAELSTKTSGNDINEIFHNLKQSTTLDIYLPEMRLAGELEVIRLDMQKEKLLLAMEFKHISFDVDPLLYNRRTYRKSLPGPGKILIDGNYYDFNALNVSVEGLMARLDGAVDITPGTVTVFEFKQLELNGEIKIVWVDHTADNETIIGMQYLNMKNSSIKGIPRFSIKN